MTSIYDEARLKGQQVVVQSILLIAEKILSAEGTAGLSMRRIATEAGCSTMVLYSLFKSKEGLIDALYVEGFRRLGQAIEKIQIDFSNDAKDDPITHLIALCDAYRWTALENPMHYGIMFGNAIPNFTPTPENLELALISMQPLISAVSQAIEQKLLSAPDATQFAMMLWSTAHGFVSLEIAGYYKQILDIPMMYHQLLLRVISPVKSIP